MEDKIFHPEHTNITLEVIMDADEVGDASLAILWLKFWSIPPPHRWAMISTLLWFKRKNSGDQVVDFK